MVRSFRCYAYAARGGPPRASQFEYSQPPYITITGLRGLMGLSANLHCTDATPHPAVLPHGLANPGAERPAFQNSYKSALSDI